MLKTWRNRVKIKNNERFLSNTWGIALLHSIFVVLTIHGKLYWKRGRLDLKSKRLNSFMVNNSSLSQAQAPFIEIRNRKRATSCQRLHISESYMNAYDTRFAMDKVNIRNHCFFLTTPLLIRFKSKVFSCIYLFSF